MNEKYIRKLIRLVEESDIESLEVGGWWGRRIKITQRLGERTNGHKETAVLTSRMVEKVVSSPAAPAAPATPPPAATTPAPAGNLVEIKSPMVGTYYAAPSPDAAPYVSLNERITVGQVVCIVEAMKLMNEIEAEVSGRVTQIMVENGQPVEFGQPLFLIDPKG